MLDVTECEKARVGRDPRYDGRFFTGVRTTGGTVSARGVSPVRRPFASTCTVIGAYGGAAYAAVGVLSFFYYWREFNEPLLYIQTIEKYTLSVGLAYLEQLDPTNWPLLLAGSVIVTAPLVVVFLVAQPFFMEPLERTGAPVQAVIRKQNS